MVNRLSRLVVVALLGFVAFSFTVSNAQASAVIATGDIRLGINDEGHLNINAPGIAINTDNVGLTYLPTGDATSPGCLCEGWGAAATTAANVVHSASADVSVGGVDNMTVDSFTSTASTATSIVHLTSLPGFSVKQEYMPSASSALFENKVTFTNTTGAALTDLRYTRAMDWDVPPTEFNEYVTIGGLPATNVLYANDNGFVNPNPYAARPAYSCGVNVNFTDCGPADHGAVFDFGFGGLADGESKSFSIFYGAAPTEAGAYAALGDVGAEVYSLGQNSLTDGHTVGGPATYIFAFKGVGGVAVPPSSSVVPEPMSLMLLGSGLVGMVGFRRKIK